MHPLGGVNACLRTVQLPSMPAATLVCPCLLRLSAQHRRFACSDGGRNKGQAIVPFRISFAGYAMPAQQRHEASLVFLKYQDKSNSHFPLSNYRIVPVRALGLIN